MPRWKSGLLYDHEWWCWHQLYWQGRLNLCLFLWKQTTSLQWCEVFNVINLPLGGRLLSLRNAAILGLSVAFPCWQVSFGSRCNQSIFAEEKVCCCTQEWCPSCYRGNYFSWVHWASTKVAEEGRKLNHVHKMGHLIHLIVEYLLSSGCSLVDSCLHARVQEIHPHSCLPNLLVIDLPILSFQVPSQPANLLVTAHKLVYRVIPPAIFPSTHRAIRCISRYSAHWGDFPSP